MASSAVALLALVKVRVCFYLPLLLKRFRSFIVAVILFDSGVPVVLWYLLGMVSWLSICESFVAYCVLHPLVLIGVVIKIAFCPWVLAPCVAVWPFHSIP